MTDREKTYSDIFRDLADELVEDRRLVVNAWNRGDKNSSDAGREILEINQILEAVLQAAKEERKSTGDVTFL